MICRMMKTPTTPVVENQGASLFGLQVKRTTKVTTKVTTMKVMSTKVMMTKVTTMKVSSKVNTNCNQDCPMPASLDSAAPDLFHTLFSAAMGRAEPNTRRLECPRAQYGLVHPPG
ncbi:hypothetical protein ACOMHN_022454 [Nucella lapillus]